MPIFYHDKDLDRMYHEVKEEQDMIDKLARAGYAPPQTFLDTLEIAEHFEMLSGEMDILVRVLYAHRKATGYEA
jgi:hypothetical protein